MNIILDNKVKLINWLSGEEIVQHVQSQGLITTMEYMRIKSIQNPIKKMTDLLDIIWNKGELSCVAFLELLKRDDVNESRPELREWIRTVHTSGASVSEEVKCRDKSDTKDTSVTTRPAPKLEQYEMSGERRGFALIINNYDFSHSHSPQLKNRKGTDVDERSLVAVFQWLGFEIMVKQDCSRESMLKALYELRDQDHTQADCVVCCVLTHGYECGLHGVDGGKVLLREIMDPLDGHNCPSLRQKPKLFFIQACRGSKEQQAVLLHSDSSSNTSDMETGVFCDSEVPRESITPAADYLVAKATVPGYVSFRQSTGTWFIQSLCKHLQELVPSRIDLLTILTEVNNEVNKKSITDKIGIRKQMPQPEFTLTKRVVFPVPKIPMPSSLS